MPRVEKKVKTRRVEISYGADFTFTWKPEDITALINVIKDTPYYRQTLFRTGSAGAKKWEATKHICLNWVADREKGWVLDLQRRKLVKRDENRKWVGTDLWTSSYNDPVKSKLKGLRDKYEDTIKTFKPKKEWREWKDIEKKEIKASLKRHFPWYFLYHSLVTGRDPNERPVLPPPRLVEPQRETSRDSTRDAGKRKRRTTTPSTEDDSDSNPVNDNAAVKVKVEDSSDFEIISPPPLKRRALSRSISVESVVTRQAVRVKREQRSSSAIASSPGIVQAEDRHSVSSQASRRGLSTDRHLSVKEEEDGTSSDSSDSDSAGESSSSVASSHSTADSASESDEDEDLTPYILPPIIPFSRHTEKPNPASASNSLVGPSSIRPTKQTTVESLPASATRPGPSLESTLQESDPKPAVEGQREAEKHFDVTDDKRYAPRCTTIPELPSLSDEDQSRQLLQYITSKPNILRSIFYCSVRKRPLWEVEAELCCRQGTQSQTWLRVARQEDLVEKRGKRWTPSAKWTGHDENPITLWIDSLLKSYWEGKRSVLDEFAEVCLGAYASKRGEGALHDKSKRGTRLAQHPLTILRWIRLDRIAAYRFLSYNQIQLCRPPYPYERIERMWYQKLIVHGAKALLWLKDNFEDGPRALVAGRIYFKTSLSTGKKSNKKKAESTDKQIELAESIAFMAGFEVVEDMDTLLAPTITEIARVFVNSWEQTCLTTQFGETVMRTSEQLEAKVPRYRSCSVAQYLSGVIQIYGNLLYEYNRSFYHAGIVQSVSMSSEAGSNSENVTQRHSTKVDSALSMTAPTTPAVTIRSVFLGTGFDPSSNPETDVGNSAIPELIALQPEQPVTDKNMYAKAIPPITDRSGGVKAPKSSLLVHEEERSQQGVTEKLSDDEEEQNDRSTAYTMRMASLCIVIPHLLELDDLQKSQDLLRYIASDEERVCNIFFRTSRKSQLWEVEAHLCIYQGIKENGWIRQAQKAGLIKREEGRWVPSENWTCHLENPITLWIDGLLQKYWRGEASVFDDYARACLGSLSTLRSGTPPSFPAGRRCGQLYDHPFTVLRWARLDRIAMHRSGMKQSRRSYVSPPNIEELWYHPLAMKMIWALLWIMSQLPFKSLRKHRFLFEDSPLRPDGISKAMVKEREVQVRWATLIAKMAGAEVVTDRKALFAESTNVIDRHIIQYWQASSFAPNMCKVAVRSPADKKANVPRYFSCSLAQFLSGVANLYGNNVFASCVNPVPVRYAKKVKGKKIMRQ